MANMTVYWSVRDKEEEHIFFLLEEHWLTVYLHLDNHFQYMTADPPNPPARQFHSFLLGSGRAAVTWVLGNLSCAFIHTYSMAQKKGKGKQKPDSTLTDFLGDLGTWNRPEAC